MGELGSLVLRIKADIDDLTKNLNKAAKDADGFGDNIGKVSKAGAAVLATLTTATIAAVKAGGEHAEQIEMVSQKTGIAKQVIQQWSVALAENNLSTDHLTTSMKALSKMMVEATDPSSQAANTFDELNVTGKTTEAVILQLADRFKEMPDGAEKARLAVELFGKSGLDMIPLLNKGSEGFKESMEAAKRFGAVLSDNTLQALGDADDAFDRLGVATKAASYQFAGLMAPAVSSVTNALSEGIGFIGRYMQAVNEMKAEQKGASSSWEKWGTILKGIIAPSLVIIPQHLAEASNKMDEIAKRTSEEGELLDSHVQLYEKQGSIQEKLGLLIRDQSIERFKYLQAEQHAQEALGRIISARIQRERDEQRKAYELDKKMREEKDNAGLVSGNSKAVKDEIAAVEALLELMPELNYLEARHLALMNAETGSAILDQERQRQMFAEARIHDLEREQELADSNFKLQAAFYQQAPHLIGQADNARAAAFMAFEIEEDRRMAILQENYTKGLLLEDDYNAKVIQLDQEMQVKRMQTIQQFPTFWEQQLQSLVQSNAFSLASITGQWNNATAQWIQGNGNFQAVWQQTQTTLLTSGLQFLEQWIAQVALSQLKELGMQEALASAKAAVTTAFLGQQLAEEQAANKTAIGMAGSAVASIMAVGEAGLGAGLAVVEATAGIFAAIAAALAASVIGAPLAPAYAAAAGAVQGVGAAAVAAGQGALAGATASAAGVLSGAMAFEKGGIAMGPTLGLMAEAGSPEAAIPLNDRGAAFMQDAFGFGGGGATIIFEEDGRRTAVYTMQNMQKVYRIKRGNR